MKHVAAIGGIGTFPAKRDTHLRRLAIVRPILTGVLLQLPVGCADGPPAADVVFQDPDLHPCNSGSISLPGRENHLVLTRSWGGEEGSPQFGEVTALAVDDLGTLVVADGVGRAVIAIRPDGGFKRYQREGRGPGEFQYPAAISFFRDSVIIFDRAQWTLTYLNGNLDYLGTTHLPPLARFGQPTTVVLGKDSQHYALSYAEFQPSLERSLGGRRRGVGIGGADVVRLDNEAHAWRSIVSVPVLETYVDMSGGVLMDIWFGATPQLAATERHVWTASTRDAVLIAIDRRTFEACSVTLRVPSVPVTASERDSFYQALDVAVRGPERQSATQEQRRRVELPREKAPLVGLVADGDRVWIGFWKQHHQSHVWARFHLENGFDIRVTLPADARVIAARDTVIYVARRAALDVPVIDAYIIRGP
jgi:hypothetical protein